MSNTDWLKASRALLIGLAGKCMWCLFADWSRIGVVSMISAWSLHAFLAGKYWGVGNDGIDVVLAIAGQLHAKEMSNSSTCYTYYEFLHVSLRFTVLFTLPLHRPNFRFQGDPSDRSPRFPSTRGVYRKNTTPCMQPSTRKKLCSFNGATFRPKCHKTLAQVLRVLFCLLWRQQVINRYFVRPIKGNRFWNSVHKAAFTLSDNIRCRSRAFNFAKFSQHSVFTAYFVQHLSHCWLHITWITATIRYSDLSWFLHSQADPG